MPKKKNPEDDFPRVFECPHCSDRQGTLGRSVEHVCPTVHRKTKYKLVKGTI
jgi:hypothetical protein